ncbi:MAG: peptidase U32 [Actinobacteria bacterium]|nr:peptidase U32 [Actinomycetota bacterium]
MSMSTIPELLAPAGNLEKLQIAFAHGADAVYVGGHVFGLRKYADNFTDAQLERGIQMANEQGKSVYVILNGMAHHSDLGPIASYLSTLQRLGPHGLIIADRGVFELAKQHTNLPLHVSTQACITNAHAALSWVKAGASRLILAREVSLSECQEIHDVTGTELEIFVHGAMCASYSGKCVISNYSVGRDSNRGGCIQSCRHPYQFQEQAPTHMMNAKDLNALSLLPQICKAPIASIKVEGRMKSNLYLANVVASYRHALDAIASGEHQAFQDQKDTLNQQLSSVSNRTFSTGGLTQRPAQESVLANFNGYNKSAVFVGTVKAISSDGQPFISLKTEIHKGDQLTVLSQTGRRYLLDVTNMQTPNGTPLSSARANQLVKVQASGPFQRFDVVQKTLT